MSLTYLKGLKYQTTKDTLYSIEVTAEWAKAVNLVHEAGCEWISYHTTTVGDLVYIHVKIKEGYGWDGCSGPTWDTPSTMQASLLHDALYQLIRRELLPKEFKHVADTAFYNQMITDGVWKIRARAYYKAVDRWGRGATLPSHKRKVYEAP